MISFCDLRIFSKTFRDWSVPLINFLPVEVCRWLGRVKLPSISTLTMSIWFSMFDCLTIFSIFYDDIRLTILSLALSCWLITSKMASLVIFGSAFFIVDLKILDRRSTISWCLNLSLLTRENESSTLLNLLDHILCLTKVSRTNFICWGMRSSTLSIELLSRHFDLQTIRILSKILIIRYTYSIRMSSPVIIIFYFSFLGSPSPLLSFSFDAELALFCSLIVARRGYSLHSPVVESSTWEFDLCNFEFLLPIVSSGLLQSPLSLEMSTL